jgi:UDP-N-acetylmuramyl tripeptide synthase
MLNILLILLGKCINFTSRIFNLGNGSTWPGHIALSVNKNFICEIIKYSPIKIVIIVGTNGKTTTSKMITTILEKNKKSVMHNTSGANLLNGIASSFIFNTNVFGKVNKDYAIFEVDENVLPLMLKEMTPHAILLLNLFRDQLDRYGEIDSIMKKWQTALAQLQNGTMVLLNADDPKIAYLGKDLKANVSYFGLEEKTINKTLQHASDSTYCPNCQTKLTYQKIYYSHLGLWSCPQCKIKRPKPEMSMIYYPLSGTYNKYNTLAAALFAKQEGISEANIEKALKTVTPAFGRQEMLKIDGKKVQIFLAKNPASFNQTLETIKNLGGKTVLFVLNDRIPDGRDVSWIWDIDIEDYIDEFENIIVSGDRVYDMGLRIEYSFKSPSDKQSTSRIKNTEDKLKIHESLDEAIKESLSLLKQNETLYILPTYSAMLEVRKILTGKKIL